MAEKFRINTVDDLFWHRKDQDLAGLIILTRHAPYHKEGASHPFEPGRVTPEGIIRTRTETAGIMEQFGTDIRDWRFYVDAGPSTRTQETAEVIGLEVWNRSRRRSLANNNLLNACREGTALPVSTSAFANVDPRLAEANMNHSPKFLSYMDKKFGSERGNDWYEAFLRDGQEVREARRRFRVQGSGGIASRATSLIYERAREIVTTHRSGGKFKFICNFQVTHADVIVSWLWAKGHQVDPFAFDNNHYLALAVSNQGVVYNSRYGDINTGLNGIT